MHEYRTGEGKKSFYCCRMGEDRGYFLLLKELITRSVRYQPVFHTLYFTLHCARVLNNVVLTTVIEMVVILDGRVLLCCN